MSHNPPIKLLEGALLIGDAHYSFKHHEFLGFLKALKAQEIQTPQLILMGDLFDLLFGPIAKTHERNQEAIDLINTLSDNIEILYLEGNHDFELKALFNGVRCFGIKEQPLVCEYNGEKVGLAHGDFNGTYTYRFYTNLIRKPMILKILNLLNSIGANFILNALDQKLQRKHDCQKLGDFETYVTKHLSSIDLLTHAMFIEGHHHQDRAFVIEGCRYINLPAFACGNSYMRLIKGTLESERLILEESCRV